MGPMNKVSDRINMCKTNRILLTAVLYALTVDSAVVWVVQALPVKEKLEFAIRLYI